MNMKVRTKYFVCFYFFLFFSVCIFSLKGSEISLQKQNLAPSYIYLFGTDELGRDLLPRICLGSLTSLFIGLYAFVVEGVIGLSIGCLLAFSGGYFLKIGNNFLNIFHAIPYPIFLIAITSILGPGLFTIMIAISLTGWINIARIAKAKTLQILHADYITAAYHLGLNKWQMLIHHILPNIIYEIRSALILTIPSAIFFESFMSFLGLGIQPPYPSLGNLIHEAAPNISNYPHQMIFPILFLVVILYGCQKLEKSLSFNEGGLAKIFEDNQK